MCCSFDKKMTISKEYTSEIVVQKSRFISYFFHCENVDELKKRIKEFKLSNPKARHVVHAAIFTQARTVFSYSDDREPPYTAGLPIFNILKGSAYTDVAIVVIRYFGGKLLGRSGLIKAYKDAALSVINKT